MRASERRAAEAAEAAKVAQARERREDRREERDLRLFELAEQARMTRSHLVVTTIATMIASLLGATVAVVGIREASDDATRNLQTSSANSIRAVTSASRNNSDQIAATATGSRDQFLRAERREVYRDIAARVRALRIVAENTRISVEQGQSVSLAENELDRVYDLAQAAAAEGRLLANDELYPLVIKLGRSARELRDLTRNLILASQPVVDPTQKCRGRQAADLVNTFLDRARIDLGYIDMTPPEPSASQAFRSWAQVAVELFGGSRSLANTRTAAVAQWKRTCG